MVPRSCGGVMGMGVALTLAAAVHASPSGGYAGLVENASLKAQLNSQVAIAEEKRKEQFGPITPVLKYKDLDDAIARANSTEYGLGGTVFGEDFDEARRVAGLLDTGGVGINGSLGAPAEIPFGGTKRSGVGRELGRSGMDAVRRVDAPTPGDRQYRRSQRDV